jgi:predicted dehydrogenase
MSAGLSVVIVGAGVIGANHAAAIERHPRLHVVALVDPIREAASRLAGQIAGAPAVYADLATALAQQRPQVVVICTPSGEHVTQALEALDAGCHVVIEKPLDVSVARGRLLRDRAKGQVVAVISQHRFDPATVAVTEAIAAGRLGRLTSAVASVPWWRAQSYYDSAGWRGTWALDGGGALMNQGVHTVDLLLALLGRPAEVFAWTGRVAHEGIEVEDVAAAVLRFPSGALATLHATTAAYPGMGVRVQVHGDGGSAIIQDDDLEYLGSEPVRPGPKPADGFVAGHLRQYEDIVDAIETGRPPAVGVEEGLLALAVVEAVYRSADLGRPVKLEEIL